MITKRRTTSDLRSRHLIVGAGGGLAREVVRELVRRSDVGDLVLLTRDTKKLRDYLQPVNVRKGTNRPKLLSLDINCLRSHRRVLSVIGSCQYDVIHVFTGIQGDVARLGLLGIDRRESSRVLWINAVGILRFLVDLDVHGCIGKNTKIVVLSSAAGSISQRGRLPHHRPGGNTLYRGSKALLNSMIKNLAYDWNCDSRKRSRPIVLLHPGYYATNAQSSSAKDGPAAFVTKYLKLVEDLAEAHCGTFINTDMEIVDW